MTFFNTFQQKIAGMMLFIAIVFRQELQKIISVSAKFLSQKRTKHLRQAEPGEMPPNPETPVVEMELVTEEIPAPPVGVVNAIVVRQEKEFKDPELPVQVVDDKSPVFKWVFSWEGWEEKRGVQTGDVVVWIDLKKNEINDAWASTGDKITHNGISYVNVN